jgi:uncharacterized protein
MFRKLNLDDKESLYHLLKQKPSENLFILWGIEAYGFSNEIQTFWGEFNRSDKLIGLLYKFKDKFTPYGVGNFDIEKFAAIILKDSSANVFAGIESITEKFKPFLSNKFPNHRSLLYAELKNTTKVNCKTHTDVKKATSKEVGKIIELYKCIPEFQGDNLNSESIVQNIKNRWSRNYYIENKNGFVSSASTVCENRFSAMVSGVCTLEAFKHKGYATKCLENLIMDLQSEGKNLCLFYDNPKAGEIYKRLGFQDIQKWSLSTS